MLHIGQPIKLTDGELAIYLGVDMHANNPFGETVILVSSGEIKRINSFDAPMTVKDRKWTYSHILNKEGKLEYKIFSENIGSFFGYIDEFPGYEFLKNEMIEYLKELENAYK